MSRARLSVCVLAALLLAGCGGQEEPPEAGPVVESSTPTPTPTPSPTPSPTPTVSPRPTPAKAPAADCTGSFKNGTFTFNGSDIFITDGAFSCGGPTIGYERLRTAIRFSYGSKTVTLGPRKSARLAGYRIRVGVANSKQATFTVDLL